MEVLLWVNVCNLLLETTQAKNRGLLMWAKEPNGAKPCFSNPVFLLQQL